MLHQVFQVFRRYAVEHLHLKKQGFPLLDEHGAQIGFLDTVSLNGNRLHLAGWCEAERVALITPGYRLDTVPSLHRPDVAAVRGGTPNLGFELDMPFAEGATWLEVENGALRYLHAIRAFDAMDVRHAERRMVLPFLRDLLQVIPSAVQWQVRRDPAAKARIKAALRFGERGGARLTMGDALFDTAPAPVPPGLDAATVTIIVPVFNAFDLLPEVLDRVLRHTDLAWRLLLIEDASTDARVRPWLRDWVAAAEARQPGQVMLIENDRNLGFIRSVNLALKRALAYGDPVVLLNSDALVPAGWARRLIRPMYAHDHVASVTPMSNDAEIFSVPAICKRTVLRPGEVDAIDAVARQFHAGAGIVATPTGVGFCMAINPAFLRQVPDLDTGFGRGYGEEVDWCQKVRMKGGRHLALPGLFVEHRGGASFGSAEKQQLVQANNAVISRRYPTYDQEVATFIKHDPLATPRLALAFAWAAARQPVGVAVPIYLAHSLGGGAEKYLSDRIAADIAGGGGAVVLRVGGSHRFRLELHSAAGMIHGVTGDIGLVRRFLAPLTARRVVYSCGVGDHDPVTLPDHLMALAGGPQDCIEVLFHDYFPISPSYTLLNDQGVFAGVPRADDRSPVHSARRPDGTRVSLTEWQAAWARVLRRADAVVVFSQDSAAKVRAVWPEVQSRVVLRPHRMLFDIPQVAWPTGGARPVIGVLGNIGLQKGVGVLADLSRRLAETRDADLVVIGNIDTAYKLAPPAKVHGNYHLRDIPDLVARYGISLWFIPSIWPETFSYATHEVLATGLPVVCFDLGAQAEAVRAAMGRNAPARVIDLAHAAGPSERLVEQLLNLPLYESA